VRPGLRAGEPGVLSANADEGYHFTGWSGACSGVADCSITVAGETSVAAAFASNPYLTIKVVGGKGRVNVPDLAQSCGKATCRYQFPFAAPTVVSAIPARGFRFAGWAGACTGTRRTCTVSLKADKTLTARFATTLKR